jgi:hypothetical protein
MQRNGNTTMKCARVTLSSEATVGSRATNRSIPMVMILKATEEVVDHSLINTHRPLIINLKATLTTQTINSMKTPSLTNSTSHGSTKTTKMRELSIKNAPSSRRLRPVGHTLISITSIRSKDSGISIIRDSNSDKSGMPIITRDFKGRALGLKLKL